MVRAFFAWSLATLLMLGADVPGFQPEAKEPAGGMLVKLHRTTLPDGARLQMGKLAGYRYVFECSTAGISPDGKLLVVGPSPFHVVNVASGKMLARIQTLASDRFQSVVFSLDGQRLVLRRGSLIEVWEAATGKLLGEFGAQGSASASGTDCSMSGDGSLVAAASKTVSEKRGLVVAWDVATGRKILSAETLHLECSIALAPDGKTLVSWGRRRPGMANDKDTSIQVWDVAAGKPLRRIVLDSAVSAVAYSPDSKTLAVSSFKESLHLFDVATGTAGFRFEDKGNLGQGSLRFSPAGDLLVAMHSGAASVGVDTGAYFGDGGRLQAWNVRTGKPVHLVDGPQCRIRDVGFPGNGRILALGTRGQTLYVWDATAVGMEPRFQGHRTTVRGVAFSADGKTLITVGNDQRALWWNTETGTEEGALHLAPKELPFRRSDQTGAVTLSADGRIAGAHGQSVRLWNLEKKEEIGDFQVFGSLRLGLCLSADGSKAAWAGTFKSPRVLEVRTGKELYTLPGSKDLEKLQSSVVTSRALFAPSGKFFAVHGQSSERGDSFTYLSVWDLVADRQVFHKRFSSRIADSALGGLAFSPDSKHLVCNDGRRFNRSARVGDRRGNSPPQRGSAVRPVSLRLFARRTIPRGRQLVQPCGDRRLGTGHASAPGGPQGTRGWRHLPGVRTRQRHPGQRQHRHDLLALGLCGQGAPASTAGRG